MSGAPAVAPGAPPGLCASVAALLQLLARGASEEDSLALEAHAGSALGPNVVGVPARLLVPSTLPQSVLKVLEVEAMKPWTVRLARASGAVSALAATWTVPLRPQPRKRGLVGGELDWPLADVEAIIDKLEAGPIPPTGTIDARPSLVALWALAAPVSVRGSAETARLLLLARALAATLGADVPSEDATLADLVVPLPGVVVRNQSDDVVTFVTLDPSRAYALADIEAAIAAAKE